MRFLLLAICTLATSVSSAQTAGLPQFSDYPTGPAYRGRVAPLVEASSPTARLYRTATREAMARGANFAGHYVVATFGCGTECESGHIVDARTGRAVMDIPFELSYAEYLPDSRLITVNAPSMIFEARGGMDGPIPLRYQSEYWVFEGDSLRLLGGLVASDLDRIRGGGPAPPLRQQTPGDVLVPLAVGNTWTYASADGASTVTYRVEAPRTGADEYGQPLRGFTVARTARGAGGERRTVEAWESAGGLSVESEDGSVDYSYSYGVPEAEAYDGERVEAGVYRDGDVSRDAACYLAGPTEDDPNVQPSRTCFVPRLGMVSRTEAGETLTLTAHTLR